MMGKLRWMLGACAAITLSITAFGQQEGPENTVFISQGPPPPGMAVGGPGPGGMAFGHIEVLGFEGIHGGKVVTGAPFSAVAVTENAQTLGDGSKINQKTQANLYRDSQGRFRREVTLPGFGPLAAQEPSRSFVVISDPVAQTEFVLEMDRKIARQLPGGKGPRGPKDGPRDVMKFRKDAMEDNPNFKKEDLGTQTINGLSAKGTRVTHTIPAGQIGNDRPLMIVNEVWYSPDLQIVVQSKRSDPRFGETNYSLTNIQRSEPAATLFAVPAGFKVEKGRGKMVFHQEGGTPPPPPPDAGPGTGL